MASLGTNDECISATGLWPHQHAQQRLKLSKQLQSMCPLVRWLGDVEQAWSYCSLNPPQQHSSGWATL